MNYDREIFTGRCTMGKYVRGEKIYSVSELMECINRNESMYFRDKVRNAAWFQNQQIHWINNWLSRGAIYKAVPRENAKIVQVTEKDYKNLKEKATAFYMLRDYLKVREYSPGRYDICINSGENQDGDSLGDIDKEEYEFLKEVLK